jgi:hypothetical protein
MWMNRIRSGFVFNTSTISIVVIVRSIHQHEAEGITWFRSIPQRFNMEAVTPCCLKYIDAARFH